MCELNLYVDVVQFYHTTF